MQSGIKGCLCTTICIVARIKRELSLIQEQLGRVDIEYAEITAEEPDRGKEGAVRIATMHRVKGLEFDEVILASMNEEIVPLSGAMDGKGDAVEKRQADLEERALVYVSMTRAKKKLIVTSYGQESPYLVGK